MDSKELKSLAKELCGDHCGDPNTNYFQMIGEVLTELIDERDALLDSVQTLILERYELLKVVDAARDVGEHCSHTELEYRIMQLDQRRKPKDKRTTEGESR